MVFAFFRDGLSLEVYFPGKIASHICTYGLCVISESPPKTVIDNIFLQIFLHISGT